MIEFNVVENAKPILIYVLTVFILVATVFLLFSLYVDVDLLVNPCDACSKNNPAMQNCIASYNKEMFSNLPSLLEVPESFVDFQE